MSEEEAERLASQIYVQFQFSSCGGRWLQIQIEEVAVIAKSALPFITTSAHVGRVIHAPQSATGQRATY